MPSRKQPPAPTPTAWRLTWDSHTWTADDLTGSDLSELAVMLGNDWAQMTPAHGPLHLVAFLSVLMQRASGDAFPKVLGEIKAAKATDLLAALTFE